MKIINKGIRDVREEPLMKAVSKIEKRKFGQYIDEDLKKEICTKKAKGKCPMVGEYS